jgi:HSP20 family protein
MRRRRWPFDFDIDDEIERIERMLERHFKHFEELPELSEPFIYGFSMRMGPDGIPQISQFGNTTRGFKPTEEREPLTDVVEHDHDVSVTIEVPGVERNDINLTTTQSTLTVDVDTPQRRYHRVVDLPCEIKPDTATATYKNGVLDVVMEKAEQKGAGFRVGVR